MTLKKIFLILFAFSFTTVFAQKNSYVCFIGGTFYKMDVLQCDYENIGTSYFFADIAVTPSGRLYGINFYDLYEIDTLNAAASHIAVVDSMGGGFNALVGLDNT